MKMVFRTLIFSVGLLGLALGYNNCAKYNFSGVTAQNNSPNGILQDGNCGADHYKEPAAQITNSVDILFMVHTTASFKSVRQTVVSGLSNFVNQLPAGADYQIGVMPAHGPQSPTTSGYFFSSDPKNLILSSKTMTSSQIMTTLTNTMNNPPVATAGSDEEGLASLYAGLDANHLAVNRSAGFFRPNTALAVVFLANEADMCGEADPGADKTDSDWANEYANSTVPDCMDANKNLVVTPLSIYNRIQAAQTGLVNGVPTVSPFLVGGVVYTNPNQQPLQNAEAEYGWGYMDLINLDAGLAVDINGNIPAGLQQIGTMTTTKLNLITDFTPSENNLDPASISVLIDGVPTKNFTYQPATNDINIPAPGHANSLIDISYCQLVAQ